MALATVTPVLSQPAAPQEVRIIPLGPMSKDVEILYGDPEIPGQPFVMRIRELPGTIVPPHSHPVDEHITVVEGTWRYGVGESFNPAALKVMKTGSYAFAPAGTMMFAYAPEAAIVQVHGMGPFLIHWKDGSMTLDDPGAEDHFEFRKGERVVAPLGAGRIRQGYASGEIVQYEIETDDGALFMGSETDLRRE
jgi:quercetin dioxygenase-like cupin family protein